MDIPRYWRLREQRYRLEGTQCKDCATLHFPPRLICPECSSEHLEAYQLKGRGRIYSFTTVFQAPDIFDKQIPYVVALVDLEEGVRITAQLTDVSEREVSVGMPVEMVTRRLHAEGEGGAISYGYKFRPLLQQAL